MRKFASNRKPLDKEQSAYEVRERLSPRREMLQNVKSRFPKVRIVPKDSLDSCVLELQKARRNTTLKPRHTISA